VFRYEIIYRHSVSLSYTTGKNRNTNHVYGFFKSLDSNAMDAATQTKTAISEERTYIYECRPIVLFNIIFPYNFCDDARSLCLPPWRYR